MWVWRRKSICVNWVLEGLIRPLFCGDKLFSHCSLASHLFPCLIVAESGSRTGVSIRDKSNTQLDCLQGFFVFGCFFFFLWKSWLTMTWFQSHDLQHLSVHISWWAPSFRCGNYSLSLDIFRGPGPDTFYFRDWKGRGKKYWDVMVLSLIF